jgi:putative aminopeptidase FrvX
MVPDFDNCSLRIDLTLKNGEKLSDFISVGDFVSLDCGFRYVDGYVNSRHLDDKASAGIFLYLSEIIKKNENKLKSRVSFFFNVTEETGQGIAATPQGDDLIVVDMGVVGKGTAGSERCVSICAKDSSGPYNYDLTNELIDLAEKNGIPFKTDIFPFYGSHGSALLRSCSDTRVALIGQGVNASHGYERTHADGLVATASLILAYIFR